MYQLISRKIQKVTPAMAAKFAEHNEYEGQRPMREKHSLMLREAIDNGRFHIGHIAVAKQGWNGGEWLLANGQHQCDAVAISGKPITAVVEEYECKTPEDFAELYRQFDNHAARSMSDIALPEARALNLKWSRDFLSKMIAGIGFIEHHNGVHKNKRIETLKKYVREGNLIWDIVSPVAKTDTRHMMRGPVIAAMIVTLKKDGADGEMFWEQVRDGENLKCSSPSLKLRNYLLSTTVGFGRGVSAPSLNAAASHKEMYSKCIVAWNAYRRGDTTSLKFYAGKETPRAI